MTQGVLLYCFDTEKVRYHGIMDRCISLIKKNLGLDITVVTNKTTLSSWSNIENCNTVVIEQEIGNRRDSQDWYNLDRCHAYDISPYNTTLLLDIDYFCYTDNLLQYMRSDCDFLITSRVHDLTDRGLYNFSENSVIPMVWATVIIFKKTAKAKNIFAQCLIARAPNGSASSDNPSSLWNARSVVSFWKFTYRRPSS